MVERGRGAIVSVASDVGRAPDRFFVDYSASKAAVLMLSKVATEVRQLPLGKLGDPDDVARVIAFLASDVSRHVTGADYTVDGGIVAAA
jgi:NAD(P)-dependent dehydrogenase (short-subunit alcohol dehydrogenase family)